MSTSTRHICRNCNFENDSSFQFCPSCGQKNTDGKITFGELWAEFQDAVFNIDSRTWRTFKAIFIPGKLTLEYFAGKHRRFVHPLRVLLVTSILIIIALSYHDVQSWKNHKYDIKDRILENYERQRVKHILEHIIDSTNAIYPEPQTQIITDTIFTSFNDSLWNLLQEYGDRYSDSIDLKYYVNLGIENREVISKRDFLTMSEDELVQAYKKDASWLEQLFFKQKAKYIKDESQLSSAIMGSISWAILLMMPFLAIVLYFLYRRRSYYYIQHLIFAFHLHAFSFLLIAILIAGINVFPSWLYLATFLTILIYVYVSMWRVYGQSKLKTLLKFILLNISYGLLFILFLFGTIIVTFLIL